MDANFRLCRRGKAGRLRTEDSPLLKSTYCLPQGDVDQYVASKQKVDSMPGKVLTIKLFLR